MSSVIVYTAICEADFHWIDQYLACLDRLSLPFVIHFDRCWHAGLAKAAIGWTEKKQGEFRETDKQAVMDLALSKKTDWVMPMDADETWERDAAVKLNTLMRFDVDYIQVQWLNVWGADGKHVRIDPPFKCLRDKLYNVHSGHWQFNSPVVNGPHLMRNGKAVRGDARCHRTWDVVCLHWGLSTRELRVEHKARWDRAYKAAIGKNPYGAWTVACDEETYPPILEENVYL